MARCVAAAFCVAVGAMSEALAMPSILGNAQILAFLDVPTRKKILSYLSKKVDVTLSMCHYCMVASCVQPIAMTVSSVPRELAEGRI